MPSEELLLDPSRPPSFQLSEYGSIYRLLAPVPGLDMAARVRAGRLGFGLPGQVNVELDCPLNDYQGHVLGLSL